MAARRARPAGTRKGWDQLAINTRKRLAQRLAAASRETVADLIDIGPAYSGQFSESWEVLNLDGTPAKFSFDRNAKDLRFGVQVVNTAPHAPQAMDLEPGVFIDPGYDPIKPLMPGGGGKRVGRGRTDVIPGDGEAGYTADADWYTTYANGGGFGESVRAGASSIVIK